MVRPHSVPVAKSSEVGNRRYACPSRAGKRPAPHVGIRV